MTAKCAKDIVRYPIYLHCDSTASHYLKLVMDSIFGIENFRNEIVWKRTHAHTGSKKFGVVHDIILFYSKSKLGKWKPTYIPYSDKYTESFFRYSDSDGRRYRYTILTGSGITKGDSGKEWKGYNPTSVGRHWAIPGYVRPLLGEKQNAPVLEALEELDKIGRVLWPKKGSGAPSFKQYLDDLEGTETNDLWLDIPPLSAKAQERLGYPTQKPLALLERIVMAGSEEGEVVLDPFCGCGTAIHAAEKLNRKWIGIDITHLAISLIERRIKDAFPSVQFEVHGTPKDYDAARDLAERDKYQFQWWAVSLIGAQPYQGKKKGADSGIDGLIYFKDDQTGDFKKIIVSVKGGENVNVAMIRDLEGTMQREKAPIGVFITLVPPTEPMKKEALGKGLYHSPLFPSLSIPSVQIVTIEGLLSGSERVIFPNVMLNDPGFKTAKKEEKEVRHGELFD